jgi:hypothetical protein
MQGDIMLPEPQKPKAASKPKPSDHKAEPLPDIVLDESAFEAPKKRRRGVPSPHKHFKRFWRFWQSLGLWGKVVLAAAILLILGAAAVGWFYFLKPNPAPAVVVHTALEKPKPPLTAASPLTGLQVDPALAKRPVTGVMIENSVFARPQSGLQEAGVVYEAIAEGGYDPKTNTYPRKEGGAAHINLKSASDRKGVRLSPKVVIALIMPYRIASDGQHSVYDDSGTGRAYFFQDGRVEIGSWEKGGIKDQIIFKTAEGKPMLLNAGQTWLTLLANKTMVGYGP